MAVSMSFIMENYKVASYDECFCGDVTALYAVGDVAVCIHCARASVAREQAQPLADNFTDMGAIAKKFFDFTESMFK